MSARLTSGCVWLMAALAVAGCGGEELTLNYQLDGIAPADVVRVETRVDVASADPREFYADQPYREIATGVGYEVRDVDGTGKRTLLVTHDATLGYVFAARFSFRLRPPVSGKAPPLSIVARAVGVSDTIGQTAALAGTFGRDAKLAVVISDQRCGGQACDANQLCCAGVGCVSVQSDVGNCGACGQGCAPSGDSCSGAACRCAGGSACTNGQSCCGGLGCVDLNRDPFHCGTCDHACNPGEACVAGVCSCGNGAACSGAQPVCCSDGSCSSDGSCACNSPGGSCSYPEVCCSGSQCADIMNDDANCGGCGQKCTAPLGCANGACACHGLICAAGNACCASGCADLANDPQNCGACGTTCAANETCGVGPSGAPTCLCGDKSCSAGELCCGGNCVNSSSSDCGSCDHACKKGESCSNAGACACNGGNACVGNQICCGSDASAGAGCFDPSSDAKHCGDCKTVCPAGQACVTGQCVPTPCNPPCSDGNSCDNGTCKCNGATACGAGQTCCGDGCHDLSGDVANCNQCGHKCATGDYCCQGACTAPSNTNCTACGATCSSCCVCHGVGSCQLGGLCLCL
jgi:hypothetical protein